MKTSTKFPVVVAILGMAVELKARLNDGQEILLTWPLRKMKGARSSPCYLTTNPAGTRLYVIPTKKATKLTPGRPDPDKIKRAGKLYERFTDWEMGEPIALNIPDAPFKKVGRAVHIVYRSDKWTGKDTDYIHTFKQPPIVHVSGGVKNPKMIALTGGRIRVLKRGIVG